MCIRDRPKPANVSSTRYSGYLNTPNKIREDPIIKRIKDAQAKIVFLFIDTIKHLLYQIVFLSNQTTYTLQKNDK